MDRDDCSTDVLLKPHWPAVPLKISWLWENSVKYLFPTSFVLVRCFKWVDKCNNLLMEVKSGCRAIKEIFLVQVMWHDILEVRIINVREADIFDSYVCTLFYRFNLTCNTDEEDKWTEMHTFNESYQKHRGIQVLLNQNILKSKDGGYKIFTFILNATLL